MPAQYKRISNAQAVDEQFWKIILKYLKKHTKNISNTVKPVYNDNTWDTKLWPLLTDGRWSDVLLLSKCGKRDSKTVVVLDKWSLAQV